ncbi:hypothetical protein NLG97_g10201 [Lecanicillium saksenae]|uniref:Uncharacterized protein n=1 Tax=Lecanicillium saksenae TaxID=468837 RepID=A0ACC1QF59_9HYPO|nr:hypothetical protein NLG97_g10201 [Lecanicillium saksenae]
MSLRNVLAFLAAAQAVTADSSHPMYFRKIDANVAKSGSLYKSLAVSGDGSLVNEQGFWFSHFTVGASKDLEILIDTGSSDAIMNPGIYQGSSSSKDTGRGFHIAYATTNPDGSGSLEASGQVYTDVITQLGANLTVSNQAIGAIRDPTSPATFPHDGLIGYAGEQGAALNASPFIFSLCESHTLSACRFGLSLRTDGTGQLHYGAVADTEFSGNLTNVKINDYWAVSGGVTVNGKAVSSGLNIVTDSGATSAASQAAVAPVPSPTKTDFPMHSSSFLSAFCARVCRSSAENHSGVRWAQYISNA